MKQGEKRIRTYKKGYLQVPDGHSLYYEFCGRRAGIPVVFLHGGPGSGFVESHKAPFDPRMFNLVLFDQRGAGRSRPFASLRANTTPRLVEDIIRIMDLAGVDKALLYGGSWGSTLALAFAIAHPRRVAGLLLRGIFLGDQRSISHDMGGSAIAFAPEAWERFLAQVPPRHRTNLVEFYYRRMRSPRREVRRRFCYEWARYEMSLLTLKTTDEEIERHVKEYSYLSLSPLEAHYLRASCFMPEGYILANAPGLSGIPVSIVHGRYDLICAPADALRLHEAIRGSRLKIVCAGHSASEPEIEKALRAELRWFAGVLAGAASPHAAGAS